MGIGFETKRVEACVAFYTALGFPLERTTRPEAGAPAFATYEDVSLSIFPATEDPRVPSHVFLVLEVDDIDGLVAKAVTAGGQMIEAPATVAWGNQCMLKDPDGRVIELSEEFSGLKR